MEKLRASCEGLGFAGVKTYIQSGNVIFQAPKLSPAALSKKLGECIVKDFGFLSEVISRSREEMKKIIDDNPVRQRTRHRSARSCTWCFFRKRPPPAGLKNCRS